MKHFIIFTLFYCLLISHGSAENTLSLGGQLIYRDYHEKIHSEARSDEKGLIPGLYLTFRHFCKPILFFEGNFSYYEGKTRYLGSLQDLFTGEIESYRSWTKNILIDTSIKTSVPYINFTKKDFFCAPFLGTGYKFWSRNSSHFDLYGFDEAYRWIYLSSGLFMTYHHNCFEISLLGELRWVRLATLELFDIAPYLIKTTLGNRTHAVINIPLSYHLKNHLLSISVVPFFLYEQLGKSKEIELQIRSIKEPSHRCYTVGCQFLLSYKL